MHAYTHKHICIFTILDKIKMEGRPLGIIAKGLNSGLEVTKFKFQLCYYIHF